jgi:hypothetical protein
VEAQYNLIAFDKRSFFRFGELKVGKKRVKTPVKAFDLSKFLPKVSLRYTEPKVNEIYKTFDKGYLSDLIKNNGAQRELNYWFNSLIKKSNKKDVNIFLASYKDEKPSDTELEFLIATEKSYSDFIVVPAFQELKNADYAAFEKHMEFLSNFVEKAESFGDKPVMGCIQFDIPFEFIKPLIEFYLSRGVQSFCIDFGGRTPTSLIQNLQQIQRIIYKEEVTPFVHAFNVNMGRLLRNEPVIPAKDILSYGFGVDSLGNRHIRPRGPKNDDEYWARIRERAKNLFRLFSRATYGYFRVEGQKELKRIYPKDSSIPMSVFTESIDKKIKAQLLLNSEQIAIETMILREQIENDNVMDYVSGKRYVAEEIKKVEAARKTLNWTLDYFLS